MTTEETQTEKRGWLTKRTVIVTSWASVSTALLLMVLIGGAVYLNDVQSRCETDEGGEGDMTVETRDENDGEGETVWDNDQQTELYIKKNDDGAIVFMMASDFKKKISTLYLTTYDVCLLASGENMNWMEKWGEDKKGSGEKNTTDGIDVLSNFKMDNKVTDMSIVPKVIRPFCEGKKIYWLDPDTKESAVGVEKRHVEPLCSDNSLTTYAWFTCVETDCCCPPSNWRKNPITYRYANVHFCIAGDSIIFHCHIFLDWPCGYPQWGCFCP